MDEALVSVVVPCYNGSETIDATLKSVRAQTYRRLEIIVVDDGSKDDSAALAERHAAEDPRVRVIRKANGGVADARNAGIRASRGAFVAPIDADDLWHPTKIQKQIAAFHRADPSTTYVYCMSYLIDSQDRVIGVVGIDGFSGDVFLRSLLINFVGNASTIVVRREAIDRVGGFDSSAQARGIYGSEDVLVQSLLAALGPVAVVPEWLVGYRRSPGAMSLDQGRMKRAAKWYIDRVQAALPDLPESVAADAAAGIDARFAVARARRGAVGAAFSDAWSAVRRAPGHALAVMSSYGWRPLHRIGRRILGTTPSVPGPRFAEADPADGAAWMPPAAIPERLRALAPLERDFAARMRPRLWSEGFADVAPLGIAPASD